ncbi:MAG: DUF2975 domain-containing protein, partial [Ignavibacteriae bacterium]|nr:DUF2975 domain-containing protein [Ignavibacteriota bacterium]
LSLAALKALRIIKYCAISIIGFAAVGEIIIMLSSSDDRAGGVFMGILITFTAIIVAISVGKFERILQNSIDIRSQNNLTV